MQKKTKKHVQQQVAQSSDWEKETKKHERNELLKKVFIWVAIGSVAFAGLAALVVLADRSGGGGPNSEPIINENVREVSVENDIIIGNPDAKVALIKYSDFQCPACASYNPTLKQIESSYPDNVKIVYRFYPIDSIHPNAAISAQAAYAAWKLGKFSEMKDELYNNQNSWANLDDPEEELVTYATSIGLNEDEFTKLMNSDEAKEYVDNARAEAISLGINATPTFFIGKKQISARDFEDFQALIDQELGNTPASDSSEETIDTEETEPTLPPLQ